MILLLGVKDIRQCLKEQVSNTDFRKTFPNIDYAMLGYDIITGYHDSNSHDPGFTRPIFKADYSGNHFSSNCRYIIPKGFLLIPDVSCVTSFSSTIIRNSLELQKSLAVSVSASGGFGAFSFSASSSYQKTSSDVSSGEKVYIISSSKCSYFFSKIDQLETPPFDPKFLRWAKKLEGENNKGLVEFVRYFGTHFPIGVVFGARYIKKHSMTTESYKKASSSEISVSAQASYFSGSAGFSLDKKQ